MKTAEKTAVSPEALAREALDAPRITLNDVATALGASRAALEDSVKRNWADLSSLTGSELSAGMRAHGERVKRLIVMHEQMMAK